MFRVIPRMFEKPETARSFDDLAIGSTVMGIAPRLREIDDYGLVCDLLPTLSPRPSDISIGHARRVQRPQDRRLGGYRQFDKAFLEPSIRAFQRSHLRGREAGTSPIDQSCENCREQSSVALRAFELKIIAQSTSISLCVVGKPRVRRQKVDRLFGSRLTTNKSLE